MSLPRALILALLGPSAQALAATYPVSPPVTEVVLFPSQAEVSRSVARDLPAGDHQFVIGDLPELDLDNLRVEVEGATLEGVRERRASEAEDVSRRRQALDDEIAALQRRLSEADAADALDRQQIERLQSLFGQAPQGQALFSEVPVDQWSRAWKQLGDAVTARQTAINERAARRPDMERELRALQDQRAQLGQAQQARRELVLDVNAPAATTAHVTLHYFTGSAGWGNRLQVNLHSDERQVALAAVAEIENRTGEDWRDVRATLGLLPAGYRAVPEPSPWIVGLAEAGQGGLASRNFSAEPAMELLDAAPRKAVSAPAPMPVAHGVDMRVPLDTPLTLASDGSSARVTYRRATLPVTLTRESYLWQQPAVLLVGEWRNDGGVPWLGGEVSLSRDGQRLTRYRRTAAIQIGERVRMSFGDDPRLRVKVVEQPASHGETGLINKEKTLAVSRTVTLSSGYAHPVEVQLYDRRPVASDERIEVEATGAAPDRSGVRDIQGLVAWDREVEGGGELNIEHGYRLRYPTDMTLTGIPGGR
ncbi:mucoidy inhibitor MuiA family protein [Alloalcanivorax marinus]|uniref:mucoidy inhibitor MuiA family protein n=1 Tax=Alloalcanivorax marinus TaxID=1177169 RepID=UPI001EE40BCC|nr:mucoidy inhibitor MuiA family protein [Alloalcanivorax marinus]